MDEWSSAHVHSASEAAPLCKVPPVPVRAAEHVTPRLLAIMQNVVGAGRMRIRRREEFMNSIAFCRLGAR
jgi:hypothetical protein